MNSGTPRILFNRSFITLKSDYRKFCVNLPLKYTEKGCSGDKMMNKLRQKTPIGKLDEIESGQHPYQEKEPLEPFPDGVNPITGEKNGPKGPEPTRYGDWERKGRRASYDNIWHVVPATNLFPGKCMKILTGRKTQKWQAYVVPEADGTSSIWTDEEVSSVKMKGLV